jgi:hypothetical protein
MPPAARRFKIATWRTSWPKDSARQSSSASSVSSRAFPIRRPLVRLSPGIVSVATWPNPYAFLRSTCATPNNETRTQVGCFGHLWFHRPPTSQAGFFCGNRHVKALRQSNAEPPRSVAIEIAPYYATGTSSRQRRGGSRQGHLGEPSPGGQGARDTARDSRTRLARLSACARPARRGRVNLRPMSCRSFERCRRPAMPATTQLPANLTPGRSLQRGVDGGRTFKWGKSWSARRSDRTIGRSASCRKRPMARQPRPLHGAVQQFGTPTASPILSHRPVRNVSVPR